MTTTRIADGHYFVSIDHNDPEPATVLDGRVFVCGAQKPFALDNDAIRIMSTAVEGRSVFSHD